MGALCTSEEGGSEDKKDVGRAAPSPPMKLVLLGPGQSGKSTLVKQLLRIHRGGMDQKRRREHLEPVNNDMLTSLEILLEKVDKYMLEDAKLGYSKDLETDVEKLRDFLDTGDRLIPIDEDIGNIIQKFWNDPGVQRCCYFVNDPEFEITPSATYFFENTFRICRRGYIPSTDDVIRVRWRTTGIYEEKFEMKGEKYVLVDLGGQKSERRKWLKSFENGDVTALIFVAALSGFHMGCKEDYNITQLEEAFNLFDSFASPEKQEFERKIPVILFLNKYDIFCEQVKTQNITECPLLKGFKGNCRDINATSRYIEKVFKTIRVSSADSPIPWYCHFTNATDENIVKNVFCDIRDNVLHEGLLEAGLI